jgi:hypothetical protein
METNAVFRPELPLLRNLMVYQHEKNRCRSSVFFMQRATFRVSLAWAPEEP